jgi:hypothetical protein
MSAVAVLRTFFAARWRRGIQGRGASTAARGRLHGAGRTGPPTSPAASTVRSNRDACDFEAWQQSLEPAEQAHAAEVARERAKILDDPITGALLLLALDDAAAAEVLLLARCQRSAYWSHSVIGVLEPAG